MKNPFIFIFNPQDVDAKNLGRGFSYDSLKEDQEPNPWESTKCIGDWVMGSWDFGFRLYWSQP